ncbi:hypothetical protein GLOTRDRAFT_126028 [Gloeophyllum trabeum ATCC 11539]|uniref:Novel STAND NTPase 1 domain-containing protein n=1 Tax=Gloeophyllum trabeum (strain ATCC 11539 / FP-39264 / Madison 617) TaxID=670483 RepID=S7QKG3_GLOTA|nr:uncharacterized protein GLOTRDRAFT_126028 [Gloeophyllum trabeum ATCC 11539]EPQ59733.1 hypothetical protein GLOTRDRAFT_126028 [Gloeophyllum trabeum ATCC 11539]
MSSPRPEAERLGSRSVVLANLREALTVVANVADGGINVPFVKGAMQIAVQVIDAAELVRKNKEDCREVAAMAAQTMLNLIKPLQGKDEGDITEALRDQLGDLQLKLSEDEQVLDSSSILLSSTPPPMPAVFHGREGEVSDAVATILGTSCISPSHLAILGSGGMGKTSLALAILHHEQVKEHFKKHIYFVPCESATSPEQLVSHITSVLRVQKVKDQDILTCLDIFLRAVPELLLVLDNFETPYHNSENTQQIVEILGRIGCIPQVTIIVTMRGDSTPRGTLWGVPLYAGSLPPEASVKTFADISQKDAKDPKLSQLLAKIDHVPLAVTLVSNLAKVESVSNLLRQWERRKTAMLKDETGNAKDNNVEVSIEMSIQSKIVEAQTDALPLLAIISYLPDGLLDPYSEDTHPGTQKWGVMTSLMKGREDAVTALSRTGLVQKTVGGFNTLSPIRQYVLKQYPPSEEHLRILEAYYINLLCGSHPEHHSDIHHHLSVEAGNVMWLVKDRTQNQSPVPPGLLEAAYNMSSFLHKHFRYDEAIQMLLQALQGYEEIGDKHGVTGCLESLGDIFCMMSRYEEAALKLQEALQGYKEIGDTHGVAGYLWSLGVILKNAARYDEATEKLELSLEAYRSIGSERAKALCVWHLDEISRIKGGGGHTLS